MLNVIRVYWATRMSADASMPDISETNPAEINMKTHVVTARSLCSGVDRPFASAAGWVDVFNIFRGCSWSTIGCSDGLLASRSMACCDTGLLLPLESPHSFWP
jgi:hypothetical protein